MTRAWNALIICLLSGSALAQGSPLRLTLAEAIHRGLQSNLGVLVAQSRTQEAAAVSERRQSLLLPRVQIDAPVAVQSRSLAAMGISMPSLPPNIKIPGLPLPQVVGPFSTYDVHAYVDQPIVDLTSLHTLRSSRLALAAARSDDQDARDLVIRSVAALYLSAQAQFAQMVAAQSQVDTAEALEKLALDQRAAGVATGIDVLRAQVQTANERQSLVQARNRAKSAVLVLARNIGVSPGTEIELAEPLEFRSTIGVHVQEVLPAALQARPDYQSLLRQRDSLNEQIRASRARFLPRLDASGNYGGIGRNPGSIRPTGTVQLSLSVAVFDHDREGEAAQLQAQMRRLESQMNDARLGIEQELRQAMLDLDSAAEEVSVAQAALDLAHQEVELAQLRFSQGVTNNVEVVTAQDALSRAQQNSIIALTHHADARIELARALGNTEASYAQVFGGR
jgi:outer membrane protein TolC